MSNLREAAQAARMALRHGVRAINNLGGAIEAAPLHDAIEILDAALAAPQPKPLTMGEQLIAVIVGIWAEHPDYSIRQTLDELNRRFPAPQPEPSNESRALLEADAWMKFATACERIGQKLSLSEREVLALRDAIDQLTAILMREPQRKPLTRGEIQILLTEHFDDDTLCGDDITLVRAIEAAHDIKETK